MDKDMIHIDDLVRGQLSGREEDERPGAWLHMRELLDKNMPAGTPAPFNRRRFGGYMALLSLLAVMVTGGYMIMQNPSGPGDNNTIAGITSSPETSAHSETDLTTAAETRSGMQTGEQSANTQRNKNSVSVTASSSPAAGSVAGKGVQTLPTEKPGGTAPTVATNDVHAGAVEVPGTTHTPPADSDMAGMRQETKKTYAETVSAHDDDLTSIHQANTGNTSTGQLSPRHKSRQTEAATAANQPLSPQGQQGAADITTAVSSLSQIRENEPSPHGDQAVPEAIVNSGGNGQYATRPIPEKADNGSGKSSTGNFVTHKDTVKQINLAYRTVIDPLSRARTHVVDTTSVEKMIVEKQELVAKIPAPAANSSAYIATGNAIATDADNDASTASAAQSKRESRKSRQTFQDMYLNTKFKLSQAPFYLGITGGLNAMSSGGTFIPGIQLGLNGELELNERWSLLAELKYINRFNNGKTIDDPYRGKPYPVAPYYQGGTSYTVYDRDSLNHYFNFSTIGTANMPVMVKYSVNRFFMLAGVDLVYHFRMNAEEIDIPVTGAVLRDTLLASQSPSLLTGGDPSVQLSDLGARFGIGYLLGVGYKATPNLHLDLRLTHTFWDNAGTGGAKKVSDQLFRVPSIQFSLGYRLGGTQRTP